MLVDTRKLGAVREVVDLWLVEAALEAGQSRLAAAGSLADRIGFALRVLQIGQTWVVYAVPLDVWRRAMSLAVQGATISAAGTELLEREPWHFESVDRDDAVMATLCRLLDANADVGAGDGDRTCPPAHGLRYASVGAWFSPVKAQWAKLARGEAAPIAL